MRREMSHTMRTCAKIFLHFSEMSQVTSLKGEKTSVHQQSLGEIVVEETFADFA